MFSEIYYFWSGDLSNRVKIEAKTPEKNRTICVIGPNLLPIMEVRVNCVNASLNYIYIYIGMNKKFQITWSDLQFVENLFFLNKKSMHFKQSNKMNS